MQPVPPFGQQVPVLGQQQQRAAQAGIMQAVHSLAIGIYSRLAADRIQQGDCLPTDLHKVATDSLTAAQCYFHALGIAQFDQKDTPT